MNYQPVSSENQAYKNVGPKKANHSACIQDNIDAENSEMEAESAQDYFVLPIWSSYTSTVKSSEAKNEGEKPNKSNEKPMKLLEREFAQVTEELLLKQEIHSVHPSTQILGDPKLAVQTRSKVNKSSGAHAFKISEALEDESRIDAIQEELLQFKIQKVWILVDLPHGKKAIGTKWVYRNEKDERGVVVRNKASRSDGGEEVHSFMHNVEEVYVFNLSYVDPKCLKKSTKRLVSSLWFTPAPRACLGVMEFEAFDEESISNGSMEILKKFDFASVKTASTPIETQKPLVKDEEATDVDVHLYRSMIGSLMYLTASRPDIMFAVCACSRFQEIHNKRLSISWQETYFMAMQEVDNCGYFYYRGRICCCCQQLWASFVDSKSNESVFPSPLHPSLFPPTNTLPSPLFSSPPIPPSTPINHNIAILNLGTFIRDAYEKKLIQAALVKGRQVDLLYSLYEVFCEQKNLDDGDVFHRVIWVPEISTTFVEQFWMSAKSKTINNVRYITATVAGKPVTISEASIRSDLLFDDVDGIDTLNNQAIFDTIQLMGYERDLTVLTFNKALFSPQWKFLFHTMNHYISSKSTSWDQIPTNIATAGKNFSGNVTPLFNSILIQPTKDEGEASERPSKSQPIPLFLTQVMTNLSSSLTHLLDLLLLSLFLIPIQRVLVGIMEVTIQTKEIKDLKAQLKNLKKKAKTGRKTAKSKPTAHKDQTFDVAFDDLDDLNAMDYMETEDAHNEKGVSTEDQVSTVNPDEDENATPIATLIVFGDDETIAEFLVSMSQNKAKQKGVEIKDADDSDRPRPTSTRLVLTLNPLPKIDPKDKGKKVLEEEAELEAESEGVNEAERKFSQLANGEEIARKARIEADSILAARLQEEEREKFTIEERAKLLHDTIASKRRFHAQQRATEIRSRPPTRTQLSNQMMTYLKHVKRSDENFIAIGSAEDERIIKDVNKKATGTKKDDNIKEERKEEETPDEDKEVDYEILDKKYPIIEWKSKHLGIKPQYDEAKDLEEINLNVDWNVVSWKLHGSSGVHTLMTDEGLVIHMLVEKQYRLRKKVLVQMLELKLESKEDNTIALELIRFVKKLIVELEPENSDGNEKDL
ncbi:hypothetical protein Tco_0890635 [Tanacetum coccineum]|uniref:Reverse transcriptase Ty1/copia-type domain-containing protein n=1 Tax=Tanacetum coccineum TaxID=301880 RepID=A0ABQ5C3V5_9ASTR